MKHKDADTLVTLSKILVWGIARIYNAGHCAGRRSCIKQEQQQDLWRLWYMWELVLWEERWLDNTYGPKEARL